MAEQQRIPIDMQAQPTALAAPAPGNPAMQGPGAGNAPAPIQDFGGTPQVTPTYQTTSLADPFGGYTAYNQYTGLLQQSLDPAFQQQRQQLQEDLRARGISNSGAASYDMGNLEAQQAATLAGADAPFVQQMYGYQQQDVLANQAARNATSAANANIANEASLWNASQYGADRNQNYNAYNAYESALTGYGANEQEALLAAWLNSFGPQTGVTNAMGAATGAIGSAYGNAYTGAQQATANTLGAGMAAYGQYAAAMG